ncbi:hypothetical protein SAMN06297387_115123 [Streptomyces zhaozhouensis]|uniref:Nucleotide exchange factor GrpE n=1 Tax=Streptomyces zhaozhouensis TaxID=1300267 RepID=A0A286E053_9ACTN|nr:hypothetical protein [Streptomyces zhaozhouensis]SOD64263.1 hypothetical protein SAMN06297387_115123 [Streptomyces zhaozhouensis]
MAPTPRRRLRALVGQLRHPREFRVPPPALDPDQAAWATALLDEIAALAERATAAAEDGGPDAEDAGTGEPDAAPDTEALLRAALGLWRAERKLEQEADALTGADLRQVRRQVNAIRQALVDDGLEIQEHEGMPFDSGHSLEVLVFQEEPGLTRETVLETVRPTIHFRGRRIQMGQVIVGRPVREPAPEPADTASDTAPSS